MDDAEELLTGGLANAGKVVRVGSTVRRPTAPSGIQAVLRHLERVGFGAAPRFHGFDEQGRAIVDYVEGRADVDIDPEWARDEHLVDSVAETQRRFHDAMRTFDPTPDLDWERGLAWPGEGASIVGHNDLCVSNVVVRDGEVAAFIDFDFAAPTHPLWDVAVALRHWVPVKAAEDDRAVREQGLDQVERFRRYCSVYGTTTADRRTIVAMIGRFLDQGLATMRTRYEQGLPAYVAVWEAGYPLHNRRSRAWIDDHASVLSQ